jgi:predicted Zn-dependent protease
MERTRVDQTLLQGIAAYKQGNLQEAESLFKAILEVQPKHSYASHNLGHIAVSINQPGRALPFFKSAIEVNPKIEQFWISYIETLITERQFENAEQALKEGEEKGVASEKLKTLVQKLELVKALNTSKQAPSQAEMQELINQYQNELYEDAENLAILLTQQFPKHQFS